MNRIAVFLWLLTILLVACSSPGTAPSATPTSGLLPTLDVATSTRPDNTPVAPATVAPTAAPQAVTAVSTDVLNVRAGPGLNYAVKSQLKDGDTITIIGKSADGLWWQFSGGWVSGTYVKVNGDASGVPVATPGPMN